VAPARSGNHPCRAQQDDEPLEYGVTVGNLFGIEALVCVLVRSLTVEPGLPDRRNDDPITGQVDGLAVALIDGRHPTARERPVRGVFRSLALQGDDGFVGPAAEVAQNSVGELPFTWTWFSREMV
jgi:hypothetical protein